MAIEEPQYLQHKQLVDQNMVKQHLKQLKDVDKILILSKYTNKLHNKTQAWLKKEFKEILRRGIEEIIREKNHVYYSDIITSTIKNINELNDELNCKGMNNLINKFQKTNKNYLSEKWKQFLYNGFFTMRNNKFELVEPLFGEISSKTYTEFVMLNIPLLSLRPPYKKTD